MLELKFVDGNDKIGTVLDLECKFNPLEVVAIKNHEVQNNGWHGATLKTDKEEISITDVFIRRANLYMRDNFGNVYKVDLASEKFDADVYFCSNFKGDLSDATMDQFEADYSILKKAA